MAHFAQIDENSIVINVIVVSNDDCLDSDGSESKLGIAFCKNLLGADTNWVRTSYNNNIRCRYAGVGMKYDSTNDVFYDPTPPYPSWVLNTSTWDWDAPVEEPPFVSPEGGQYFTHTWDEPTLAWIKTATDIPNP